MIELAPKGTGKSYIFNNLSKYGWMISGGKVTRAKLFYDMAANKPGIIPNYEFVSMDEIKTIVFGDKEELQGALKGYLENGSFTMGHAKQTSTAGLILLGKVNRSPRLAQVIALRQLSRRLLEGVVDLLDVDGRNDVEARFLGHVAAPLWRHSAAP